MKRILIPVHLVLPFVFCLAAGSAPAQHDWFDPEYRYTGVGNFARIHIAAARGDVEVVRSELEKGQSPNRPVLNTGGSGSWRNLTPLLIAAEFGRVEVMRVLIEAGADVNEAHPDTGLTPLMMAAGTVPTIDGDALAFMRLLIEHGADIHARDRQGRQAIHFAAGEHITAVGIPDAALPAEARISSPKGDLIRPGIGGAIGLPSEPITKERTLARLGDHSRLELLIQAGAEVDTKNIDGIMPLMYAAKTPDVERVRLLLESGAELNARDKNRWTAALWAANRGWAEPLEFLLERGCEFETGAIGDRGALALFHAMFYHDPREKVRALLDAGADVNGKTKQGTPLIVAAARLGGGGGVVPLLDFGADPTVRDADGNSLLILAARNAVVETVEALIERGLDVNDRARGEHMRGATPLILAAESERDAGAKVRLLLDHSADVSLTMTNGVNALHAAARAGRMDAVVALIEAGMDVNEPHPPARGDDQPGLMSGGGYDMTPLMMVAYRGASFILMSEDTGEEAARALIAAGADVNVVLRSGQTALTLALQTKQPEVVRILLEAGADPDQRRAPSALFLAMEHGSADELELLLNAGADPERRGGQSTSPLHYACMTGNPTFVRLLLDAGAIVDGRDDQLCTPLMTAVRNEAWDSKFSNRRPNEIIAMLLDRGASVSAVDAGGMTALMHLCSSLVWSARTSEEYSDFVRRFIELGADVNARDKEGMTPLHHAARGRSVEAIDILLEAGADLRAVDKRGRNALDHARLQWQAARNPSPTLAYLEDLFAR